MSLVLTLLVRDEADIIADTIEAHLALGVDHIVATDNGSQDGTLDILNEYRRAGVLHLIREPPSDFSQGLWVSRMARIGYQEYGASWLIHADADEVFLPAGGVQLKEHLKSVDKNVTVMRIRRHDFIPFERPVKESPLLEMIYRKKESLNSTGNPLPPKVIHRGAPGVRVMQGNHQVRGLRLGQPRADEMVSVYHYPIRSFAQLCSKAQNIGSGYARNTVLPKSCGDHNRARYAMLLNGTLREEYERKYFFSKDRLSQALGSAELVEDQALAQHFRTRQNSLKRGRIK